MTPLASYRCCSDMPLWQAARSQGTLAHVWTARQWLCLVVGQFKMRCATIHTHRAGEAPCTGLTEVLTGMGFETDRLKTGTPARVDSRTVKFASLEAQPGDPDVRWFSFDRSVSMTPFAESDALGVSIVWQASAEGRSTF